jgi:hypothetical protein
VRCYRMQSPHEDPQTLLIEERQWCAPWGGGEDGSRCDKCEGTGRTAFECWSCLLTGPTPSCPVCRGQMRFESKCAVCRGTGEIDAKPRRGISAFPTVEGLYHYLLATEADPVGLLVELEAEPADDVDFDADQGAILVIPTAILSTRNIEPEAIDTIKAMAESPAER